MMARATVKADQMVMVKEINSPRVWWRLVLAGALMIGLEP